MHPAEEFREPGAGPPSAEQRQLAGIRLELRTNQIALEGMRRRCGVFLFTGGDVPHGRYGTASIASYLQHPFAAARIATDEVARYRDLVQAAEKAGPDAGSGPRTLRCRTALGNALLRETSEIETLGRRLESDLTLLLKEGGLG